MKLFIPRQIVGLAALSLALAVPLAHGVPARADAPPRAIIERIWEEGAVVYRGRVSFVSGSRNFDLKVNGRTFYVSALSNLPPDLRRDDEVWVYGLARGERDIRDAKVRIVGDDAGGDE